MNNLKAYKMLVQGKKMRKTCWSKNEYVMFDEDTGELIDEEGKFEDYDISQGDTWEEYK